LTWLIYLYQIAGTVLAKGRPAWVCDPALILKPNFKTERMRLTHVLLTGACSMLLFSCVSKKKLADEVAKYERLNASYTQLQNELKNCEAEKAEYANNKTNFSKKIIPQP
jgi:outer membrane murein-binding lipoprotein Lpp